jgi:L-fuconolactonase
MMMTHKIIDTHVHLWDPALLTYVWHEGNEVLDRAYVVEDYLAHTKGINIEKIVFVQAECDPSEAEAEVDWVSRLAEKSPIIRGITAWAPISKGAAAVNAHVSRLKAYPLVKAIRQIIQFEEDIDFCIKPDFVAGVQALGKHKLPFELCVVHYQLPNTIKLVQQCPDVSFILDHIGKPDIKNGVMDPWRADIETLAAMPNVCCKISGLVNEAKHHAWTVEALRPYVQHILDCFGPARVMYGGDWPVMLLAAEYRDWYAAFASIVSDHAGADVIDEMRHNAVRIYDLS